MATPNIYLNEDGDYWVPVAGVPYLTARREAKSIAALSGDVTVRYIGKEKARLTEHEVGCTCGPPACYQVVLAYHFVGQPE